MSGRPVGPFPLPTGPEFTSLLTRRPPSPSLSPHPSASFPPAQSGLPRLKSHTKLCTPLDLWPIAPGKQMHTNKARINVRIRCCNLEATPAAWLQILESKRPQTPKLQLQATIWANAHGAQSAFSGAQGHYQRVFWNTSLPRTRSLDFWFITDALLWTPLLWTFTLEPTFPDRDRVLWNSGGRCRTRLLDGERSPDMAGPQA